MISSLFLDLLSFSLSVNKINSSLVGNFFFLQQFLFALRIYQNEIQLKKLLTFLSALFIIYFVYTLFLGDGVSRFNANGNSISGLILIGISLIYLYKELNGLSHLKIYAIPMFWVAFGFLFYYAGNLLLFLLDNILSSQFSESHRMIWILHNFCNIIKNVLFAIALWHNYRNLRYSS